MLFPRLHILTLIPRNLDTSEDGDEDSGANDQLHDAEELPRRSEERLKPPPVVGIEDPGAHELGNNQLNIAHVISKIL
jgi:hypothetical protein